ncbi:MAG: hypothetical protein HZA22_04575 [Nitrospirae bacterium]|nr:hypothetical protein [Nitrospirota bacterium]
METSLNPRVSPCISTGNRLEKAPRVEVVEVETVWPTSGRVVLGCVKEDSQGYLLKSNRDEEG